MKTGITILDDAGFCDSALREQKTFIADAGPDLIGKGFRMVLQGVRLKWHQHTDWIPWWAKSLCLAGLLLNILLPIINLFLF